MPEKGIIDEAGTVLVTPWSLSVLHDLGYRLCLDRVNGEQEALLAESTPDIQALGAKLTDLNAKLSLDTGFRVLKVDESNMKDVYYAAEDYDQNRLAGLVSNIKEDRTDLDLLFGCLIDWGLRLSLPYTSEKIDGCTVHNYNDGALIACFDENVPESVVKEIAKRRPQCAVFRDAAFADSPSKINAIEMFKLYIPEEANDISRRIRVI